MGNAPFPMTRNEKLEVVGAIVLIIISIIGWGIIAYVAMHFAVKYW